MWILSWSKNLLTTLGWNWLVRNDARYGPKLSTTLQHRNPRGWGAENAWEVAFGYVSVAPFSTLSTANFNSGEWTLQWSTRQIGIAPLPLSMFSTKQRPQTALMWGGTERFGLEFTRSQIHIQHDYSLTENDAGMRDGTSVRFRCRSSI